MQANSITEHPTRSAPRCGSCKHVDTVSGALARCNHPSAPVDVVTGAPAWPCDKARAEPSGHRPPACGPDAVWFEQNSSTAEQATPASLAARFVDAWLAGSLGLPLLVYSDEQLYRAYRKWRDANGLLFPSSRMHFLVNVTAHTKSAAAQQVDLIFITCALGDGQRRSYQCWVPRGLSATADGAWLDVAEAALASYCPTAITSPISAATATTVSGVQPSGKSA